MGHNGRLLAQLHGTSPPRGSHAALPIACDAFNARTVAIREYRPPVCRRPQAATLAFRRGVGRSAFPVGKSLLAHPPFGSAQTESVRFAL